MDAKFKNLDTFKNPGKSLQNKNDVNTILGLESQISTIPFLNVTKRKWGSSSSATAKETDNNHMNKTFDNPNKIDLELSLSTGTSSQSDIDTYKRNKIQTARFLDKIVKEIRPSSTTTTAPISSVACSSGVINHPCSKNNFNIKSCKFLGCEKYHKRCKKMLDCTKSVHSRGECTVKDKRVHGGATLSFGSEKIDTNMNMNLMNWKKICAKSLDFSIGYEEAPPALEGRVHGGSIMALLSGSSEPRIGSKANNSG